MKYSNTPSDLGDVGNCWWLLAKVIDYSATNENGLTIPEIKSNIKKTFHAIHEKGKNPDFFYFLGYEQIIPSVLENLAAFKRLNCAGEPVRYSLTDSEKKF